MKMKEIREKTDTELESKLADIKKSLISLKFKKATGQLENFMTISNMKKDIARIETVLARRKLEQEQAG